VPLPQYAEHFGTHGSSVLVTTDDGVTHADLFSDEDGTTPLSNPITVGPNGFVSFYADPGIYILIESGDGTDKRTVELEAPASSGGSVPTLLFYLSGAAAGTHAVVPVDVINEWGDAQLVGDFHVPDLGLPTWLYAEVYDPAGVLASVASVRVVVFMVRDAAGALVTGDTHFHARADNVTLGDDVVFTIWDADTANVGRGSLNGADDSAVAILTAGTYRATLTLVGPIA